MAEKETSTILSKETLEKIVEGYSYPDQTLALGAVINEGQPVAQAQVSLPLAMLNRHGLIAGATGTGKTRTLQLLAESLSAAGVNVFLTDIKGDLTGIAQAGQANDALIERTKGIGQDWQGSAFPLEILRLGQTEDDGENPPEGSDNAAVRVRANLQDFGPLMLSKVLELNTTQEQSLQLVFAWAKSQKMSLHTLEDLKTVLLHLTSEAGKEELGKIGGISSATAGVILRSLSVLQSQGGDQFFGLPAFDTCDLLRTDASGRAIISALMAQDMLKRPALISTFIMWMLDNLFSTLPEVGDQEKPKLVFFFDEAHLLFSDASDAFLDQVTQTVRLIRSKGVGVFFITQTPQDIPAPVLGQLGAKIMHALRVYTPKDAKMLEETVSTFPQCDFDLGEILKTLGTGEAIVTVLDKKGRPSPVAPTRLRAPGGVMGPADPGVLAELIASSTLAQKYRPAPDPAPALDADPAATPAPVSASASPAPTTETTTTNTNPSDREEKPVVSSENTSASNPDLAERERLLKELEEQIRAEKTGTTKASGTKSTSRSSSTSRTSRNDSVIESAIKSGLRSVASTFGRELTKFLFKRK